MFCRKCGTATAEGDRFCASCGAPVSEPAANSSPADAVTRAGEEAIGVSRFATRAVPAPNDTAQRPPSTSRAPSSSSGWLTSSDSIDHGRFPPGAMLDNRYRITALLGRGGMGEVYRADDLRLGQPVALKFLPDELREDPVRLAQFHNEVRTARQVSHPNICRVYDIGEADGHLYLSMEYVDGEDLATSLRRIGRFPEDKALEIARQLCAALAAAHERGVLHRDLKPANVMLDGAGKVRLTDFGLAAVGPVVDVRAGTPAYMAPEQLLGREVTVRSDIFALGLVLYELFTGRRAFSATTIGELVGQHESRATTPFSSAVGHLDPAIERAILRCLDPDPARRPASALSVAASLPGGDPLAAALAAGETPSPEMVAAAGEGAGISVRAAAAVFVLVAAGIAVSFAMTVRMSPLERLRPRYSPDVLAQKARDALHAIGYTREARDEAFGFAWDGALIRHLRTATPAPVWEEELARRPSPLTFWYRQSPTPLTSEAFHHDMLTPGIVDRADPPPVMSGMVEVALDHEGRIVYLEAIPPQREEAAAGGGETSGQRGGGAGDWTALMALAGFDVAKLQPAGPLSNWLASSDTRAAWTGTWPDNARPVRVEAAALHGRPVAFAATGPWTLPGRTAVASERRETVFVVALIAMIVSILAGAGLLARRNLREGRSDPGSAFRLGAFMTALLIVLWACQVHLVAALGIFATFLIAICTATFYGVLVWTIYIALEPFVRRHWPQTLVSSTTLLSGRVRDPIVGRDVLFGVMIGVAITLVAQSVRLGTGEDAMSDPGSLDVLVGLRGAVAMVVLQTAYAVRTSLMFFFLLFMLRLLLRSQWAACVAFSVLFGVLNGLSSRHPVVDGLTSIVFFGLLAFSVLRWGLVTQAVAVLVANLVSNVPATLDSSAWYFGNTLVVPLGAVALAAWALVTASSRRDRRLGLTRSRSTEL
jgi:serine/threonine-protein kinase